MEPKIDFLKKSAESGLDLLFTIYNQHRHSRKTSLFPPGGRVKRGCAPQGDSAAAPVLQNGARGAEKWREWGPPGSQRVPKGLPMPPKMLPKIIKKRHPSPGVPPRVLPGCLGYPPPPKYLHF